MKTILIKCLTLLIVLSTFAAKEAQAETWGFLGGIHRYELVNEISTMTPETKFTTLFGAALYNAAYPIELDILYTSKQIATYVTENSLQLPFFYRANISKELKFGIGGFFDYNLSETYGRQKLDMGLAGSFQYQVPFGKAFLVLDARYLYGMTELPGKSRDINFLVGIVFK